jgi:predicted CopG family antitoxin
MYTENNVATKTISIDLDAYRRLRSARRGNESFSQVIKRLVHPPVDAAAYVAGIESTTMGRDAANAVREHVAARHRPRGRRR